MRFMGAPLRLGLSACAVAAFRSAVAVMAAWASTVHAQARFDSRNPLAQVAKCAIGEEESRSAIARNVPSRFSPIPGENAERFKASVRNGAVTPARWFSDTVFIIPREGRRGRFCSGVYVGGDAILTAGHCVCDLDLAEAQGEVQFQLRDDRYAISTVPKRTVMLDPDTCNLGRQPGRDLAIVFFDPDHLAENMKYNPALLGFGVRPAIPTDGQPMVPTDTLKQAQDSTVTTQPRLTPAIIASSEALVSGRHDRMMVVGYGADERGVVEVKRHACVPVVSGICGGPGDPEQFNCVPGSELVLADPVGGADTCQGDSGGAVYTVVRDRGLYYYHLAAITSRGLAGDRCGPGGIYTLITPSIVAWMRRNGVPIGAYPYPGQ